jgi:rhodanese-related sulfurtransferase
MRFLLRGLVFLGAAVVCAAVSNRLAGPERKLRWFASAGAAVKTSASGESAGNRPAATRATAPQGASGGANPAGSLSPHPDKPWVEISGDQVAALYARKDVPFLDARRSSVYRDGHIARARSFPVWEAEVDDRVKTFYGEGHDPNAPIVVYCSGGDCEDSHMLAQKLFFAGFNAVFVYKDGFPDWVERGLPVTKGSEP